jgi:hypothetical protein
MLIALWIVNVIAAVMTAPAGVGKLFVSREKAMERMAYVEDFTAAQMRWIGVAETLGVLGLILPLAFANTFPSLVVLAPVAAACLVILFVGAIRVHVRRKEQWLGPLPVLILAAASATLGFIYVASR